MDDWSEDNFGNEGARDYLSMLTTQLVATITAIMNNKSRLRPEEDGESMLMPSVDVLAQLCERCDAVPPKPDTIRQWSRKYLKAFDASADSVHPDVACQTRRRKVIENTFRWLQSLSDSYWESEDDG
jgi:hypothetical protein